MAGFNHKDARIAKLHAKGLEPAQIARKLGAPDDIERVVQGLRRAVPGWAEAELEEAASIYSDVYKDTHGIRPRGDTAGWKAEDYYHAIDDLYEYQAAEREANTIPTEGEGWRLVSE